MNKNLAVIFLFCSNLLYGQQVIKNLQWLNAGQEISELTIGNGLTLYAETENISDNEIVKITVCETGGKEDAFSGEYISRVIKNKIFFHWCLDFPYEKEEFRRDLYKDGYTVQYYFYVQYNAIKSQNSKLLDVGNSVYTQIVYEGTNDILVNKKYTIVMPDNSIVTGWTDAEGYLRQDYVKSWGNAYFYMNEETDEKHEAEPPYREPQKPVYYVVKKNDNLWKIASYDFIYGNPYLWKKIYDANKQNLIDDNNPDLIEIGQILIILPHNGEIRSGTR
ncbi:MAG: LysM peptidoglycan-binding domain-containing protein [Treponema sp.]|jgi:LysM repeat protein|nr:LysM peptidoglycan-binding domain-containing protein [Treponema sp.]